MADKSPKNSERRTELPTPVVEKKSVSGSGPAPQNGYIIPNLYLIKSYLCLMAQVKWTNSIYQQKGSKPGVTIKDGMLINNTSPYQSTTINQAVNANKMRKRAENVSQMAEAFAVGKFFG